jgi:ribosomal protein S1
MRVDVVASLIQVDGRYEVCNLHPIGELLITVDPWVLIGDTIAEGESREAVVSGIGWTVGCVVIEGGITAHLRSQDVGLAAWEEIGQVLTEGMTLTVRVEAVDRVTRQIRVSLAEQV